MKARTLTLLLVALLGGMLAAGCDRSNGATVSDATSPAPAPPADDNFKPADPAAKAAADAKIAEQENKAATSKPKGADQADAGGADAAQPKDGEKVAVLDTNLGQIVFKFLPETAPKTVKNFEDLAGKKFYDGTKFHRVIPGFMIQGGDPNTRTGEGPPGQGGPGYTIDDEFSGISHVRGIVSMANTGAPHSSGCQFFICVADATFLNGKYNVFGRVVKGMDVADKIVNLPRDPHDMPTPGEAVMKTVRIETWPLKG